MNKKILIAATLSALSFGANAELPSFNFVEVGTTTQEHDAVGGDLGGFELAGCYEFDQSLYLAGSHVLTSDRGLDLSTSSLGIGYQYGIADSTLLYTQLDWARVVMERDNAGKFDEPGYQLSVGVRSQVADSVELQAAIKHLDAGEVDPTFGDYNPTFVVLGANYQFDNDMAVYAGYENESDSDRYSIGFRYEF
ncbi:outer membrane beta-barrel protein [Aliikangiella coralliicola]|uniref:Outer membrane beta-barrel protein n=1 Tax=Aliikangiella coralliicola TaxID=2592383 RepID=A0A545UIH2_9GAMM|nr:outer membrane beta-barrel protein [Aliikangiella coralliicola]TQV89266.1 outer membrane beta-barrel protein [Aliikangiella coralliicola]